MPKYYIRNERNAGASTIYFDIQKRVPKIKMRVSTRIKVDANVWSNANKNVNAWNKFIQTEQGRSIEEKLNLIQQSVSELFAHNAIQSNADKYLVDEVVNAVVDADAIVMEQEQAKARQEQERREKNNVIRFYENFMKGITAGTIRYGNNKKYTKGSIGAWNTLRTHLYAYCSPDTTFDDISKPFADQFVVYLENAGISPAGANKYVAFFRKLCNLSAEYGINTNGASLKVWKTREADKESKRTQIYLTEEELQAIYDYPLQGRNEQARDMFILGCLSCQGYSDFSTFTKDNFGTTSNGTSIIKVEQKKTHNYVEIPITDTRVQELCKKYDYTFPYIDARKLNVRIKEVLRLVAGSCESLATKYTTTLTMQEKRREARFPILLEKYKAGEEMCAYDRAEVMKMLEYQQTHNGSPLFERNIRGEVVKYKYELVSTHTARRSGITNLYKEGILNTKEMMSISGHHDEDVFQKYIKVGTSEQADRIATKIRLAHKSNESEAI